MAYRQRMRQRKQTKATSSGASASANGLRRRYMMSVTPSALVNELSHAHRRVVHRLHDGCSRRRRWRLSERSPEASPAVTQEWALQKNRSEMSESFGCCFGASRFGSCLGASRHAPCLACHFAEEERLALPYLTPSEQVHLLTSHAVLRALEGPARNAAIAAHAAWEDELFPSRLPARLTAHFIDAHRRISAQLV